MNAIESRGKISVWILQNMRVDRLVVRKILGFTAKGEIKVNSELSPSVRDYP